MAAGDLITTDWQLEYRGLLCGDGTAYRLREPISGLDLPDVRSADAPYTRADGEVPSPLDYLSGRDLTIEFEIHASTDAAFQAAQRSFDAVFAAPAGNASPEPLVLKLPGRDAVRVNCVPRRMSRPIDMRYSLGRMARVGAQVHAHDPRVYSNAEHSESTTRQLPGSGFTPPIVPPITLGASTSGVLSISNDGNRLAPWQARLDGPLTYPTITHLESGHRLSLALSANGGVDLATGEYLTLDSAAESVLLAGVGDRRTQLTIDSAWWDLEPGLHTFELTADAGAGLLTVTARDAFHS